MMEMSFELDPCIIDFDGSVTEFELEKMREYLPTSIQEYVEVGAGGLGNSISSGRDILLMHQAFENLLQQLVNLERDDEDVAASQFLLGLCHLFAGWWNNCWHTLFLFSIHYLY